MNWLANPVVPVVVIVAGALAGLVAALALHLLLRPLSKRLPAAHLEPARRRLRRRLPLWGAILGALPAIDNLPIPPWLYAGLHAALLAGLILSVSLALADLAGAALATIGSRNGTPPPSSILTRLPPLLVVVIGILIALQTLNVPITPLLTTLGVAGLAVALALQDTLANLFAGIYILLARKLRPGDFVRLGSGEEGTIVDIDLRNTTLRELGNSLVIVPNAQLSTSIVRNYDLPEPELSVLIDVVVSYDCELEHVERVTLEEARAVLAETPGGVAQFEPLVRFNAFADYGVRFTVVLRGQAYVDQFLLRHALLKRLHARYRREGIEIPLLVQPDQLILARALAAQADVRRPPETDAAP